MKIVSSGTAFPQHYYQQHEITSALTDYWAEKSEAPERSALVERFHRNAGVDGRYTAVSLDEFRAMERWGEANDAWIDTAVELGEKAITRALEVVGVGPEKVGALFFVSITGIANPSIDARLMNRLSFNPHLRRIPIFGLGCVAGAAGLSRAADYVLAHPDQIAILLSVELCSLTWQKNDLTAANMISTALFGDGAAAVVVAGKDVQLKGPRIVATESVFYPDSEHIMGWNISEEGLKVVLSPEVPQIVLEHLGQDIDQFLGKHNLTRSDIGSWIMHTGGPKVLDAMAAALDLERDDFKYSWKWLKDIGNISSASVLVVLDDVMKNHRPKEGTYSILAAMGPGFCSEILLIRW